MAKSNIDNNPYNWSKEEILSLNYNFHPPFKLVEIFPNIKKNKYLIQSIFLFFATFLRALGRYQIKQKYTKCEILFWSGSQNNDKVLKPIFEQLPTKSNYLSKNYGLRTPKYKAYLLSLPYFLKALQIWKSTKGFDRKTFTACFDNVWLTFGYYRMVLKILKKMNPSMVVIANDHTLHGRTVIICARKLGIKSLYVQHAGIAEFFPPLQMDYAFLDGDIAHQIYKTIDPDNEAKVFEVGSPRFDHISRIRLKRKKTGKIGIAVNKVDNFNKVADYINLMGQNNEFVLRIHPAIKGVQLKEYKMLCHKYNIRISLPHNDSLENYLNDIDLLLACESYIHFDAVLSGIPSYYLEINDNFSDHYGFLKENFIEFAPFDLDPSYLSKTLNQNHENYLRKNIKNLNLLRDNSTYSTADEYARIIESLII